MWPERAARGKKGQEGDGNEGGWNVEGEGVEYVELVELRAFCEERGGMPPGEALTDLGGLNGAEEPGAGEGPPAFDGGFGDGEDFGGFPIGQADEEAEFHQLRHFGFLSGKLVEGFVDGEELILLVGAWEVEIGGVETLLAAAVPQGALAAGDIDEDAAHGFGGGGKEVGAALPLAIVAAGEAEPSFVDEGGGLEGLAGGFGRHFAGGHLPEFGVDEGEQLLGGHGVAGFDVAEDAGDVGHDLSNWRAEV